MSSRGLLIVPRLRCDVKLQPPDVPEASRERRRHELSSGDAVILVDYLPICLGPGLLVVVEFPIVSSSFVLKESHLGISTA